MSDQHRCWCGSHAGRIAFGGPEVVCYASKLHDPLSAGTPETVDLLYLAGPMTGMPDCNYPLFNDVAEQLRSAGFKVFNPAETQGDPTSYVNLLRQDLRELLDCQGVATLPGWWTSVGARNEVTVAAVLQMPVLSWEEWLR